MAAIQTIVDFFCLTFSLWLGFFIVTRSPRSKVSWLAGASLWVLSASFFNNLALLHTATITYRSTWWWGWSIALAVSFWYHMSVALLPDQLAVKRQGLVSLVYLLALNLIAMEAYTPWILSKPGSQGASETGTFQIGPLYPLFASFLILVPILSLDNLRLGLRAAQNDFIRQRLKVLIWASGFASCGALFGGLMNGSVLVMDGIVSDACFGVAVLLLGYGVARWNALVEGRAVGSDFLYTSVVFGFVVGVYLFAAWLSELLFDVPFLAFVFLIVLAVVTHSLYDWARYQLDRWVYGGQRSRKLRDRLREFSHSVPLDQDLHQRLEILFQTLCRNLRVPHGFIAIRRGEKLVSVGHVGIQNKIVSGDAQDVAIDTTQQLSPPKEFMGVREIGLLAPLHFGEHTLGILALGGRQDGTQYDEEDLALLEYFADIVAAVVHAVQRQKENVEQIESLAREVQRLEQQSQKQMREMMAYDTQQVRLSAHNEAETVAQVEDVLRHLHDYSYLGSQPLAKLQIVNSHIKVNETQTVTHIDRGKALKESLVGAMEKLMPAAECMTSPPSREWYPYVILRDCYVLGKRNREVMATLFISEGTFNRTRRRALRSMARALTEMEREALRSASVE